MPNERSISARFTGAVGSRTSAVFGELCCSPSHFRTTLVFRFDVGMELVG